MHSKELKLSTFRILYVLMVMEPASRGLLHRNATAPIPPPPGLVMGARPESVWPPLGDLQRLAA